MMREKVDRLLESDAAWKEAEADETDAFKDNLESIEFGYASTCAAWHWFHIGYHAAKGNLE